MAHCAASTRFGTTQAHRAPERSVLLRSPVPAPALRPQRRQHLIHAVPDRSGPPSIGQVDIGKLADMIALGASEDDSLDKALKLEKLGEVLQVPASQVKAMAFKRKTLTALEPAEVEDKITKISKTVGVTWDQARQMAVIQPALLVDTERQSEALQYGIKAICYELNAPRDEVIELILKHQSVLHGREMHLSVADIAHLAMLREPKGRIVD